MRLHLFSVQSLIWWNNHCFLDAFFNFQLIDSTSFPGFRLRLHFSQSNPISWRNCCFFGVCFSSWLYFFIFVPIFLKTTLETRQLILLIITSLSILLSPSLLLHYNYLGKGLLLSNLAPYVPVLVLGFEWKQTVPFRHLLLSGLLLWPASPDKSVPKQVIRKCQHYIRLEDSP